jgi:phosphoribosylamine---glycine ligase
LEAATLQRIISEVVEPTIEGARREGFPFRGVLFLGLMLTAEGPKLLEYNVRFGDPETQAILIRLKTDFVSVLQAMLQGELSDLNIEWRSGSSACVVAANRGYPGKYEPGGRIQGLDTAFDPGVQVFHAGTSRSADGSLIATGGRVLGVTAAAENLNTALRLCYDSLERIQWEGMQYRRDIGRSALTRFTGFSG